MRSVWTTAFVPFLELHLSPPQHTAVFCQDETSGIQALHRLDSVVPMALIGRARRLMRYIRATVMLTNSLRQATRWFQCNPISAKEHV